VTGLPAAIPSPAQGVWNLGPFPVRAYALCILLGIVVAIWLTDRRWRERGGRAGQVLDIAAWAVPFGIVGGRLYHVATSWQPYFGSGGHPIQALYVWEGGLGIWGAVALGGVGAYIGARRQGVLLPPFADAAAPGIVLAQGIGRLGNWFNNELYGSPTTLPWGLQVHQWDSSAGHAVTGPDGKAVLLGTFHPTFLYELLWDVAVAVALILLDRRYRFGHGRLFALYVLLYTIGRGWIEALRIDPANHILGLRLNLWTSLLVGLGALVYLVLSFRLRPGREESVLRHPDADESQDAVDSPAMTRWMAWVRTRPTRQGDGDAEGAVEDDLEGGDAVADTAADGRDDASGDGEEAEEPEQGVGYQPKHGPGGGRWRVGDLSDDRQRAGDAAGGSAGSRRDQLDWLDSAASSGESEPADTLP
jgi:prolipoprotein diacylglyceryl transferase